MIDIRTGFSIGSLSLESRVMAAPLAGITDSGCRRLQRECGAASVCTEMVSAKGLFYKNENTRYLMQHQPDESPIFLQLFGSDPEILGSQAGLVAENFDGIDLNMGCPAPKIVRNGDGSALLKDPQRIGAIVSSVVKAVTVPYGKPVTVKIRKGFSEGEDLAVPIARICEEAGAAAVAVHGRTTSQMYQGQADWNVIREVKEAVSIPVIGNGDVRDGASAIAMLKETGCDAVMVGRAAMGNPWVFTNIRDSLRAGEALPAKTLSEDEVKAMALRHAEMVCRDKGESTGIRQMRAQLSWYMKRGPKGSRRKLALETINSLEDLKRVLDSL